MKALNIVVASLLLLAICSNAQANILLEDVKLGKAYASQDWDEVIDLLEDRKVQSLSPKKKLEHYLLLTRSQLMDNKRNDALMSFATVQQYQNIATLRQEQTLAELKFLLDTNDRRLVSATNEKVFFTGNKSVNAAQSDVTMAQVFDVVEGKLQEFYSSSLKLPKFALPKNPVLSKGEFETKDEFERRIQQVTAQYERQIQFSEKRLAKLRQKAMAEREQKGALFNVEQRELLQYEVNRNFPSPQLHNVEYNTELQAFLGDLEITLGEGETHSQSVEIPVKQSQATKSLKEQLARATPVAIYSIAGGNFILEDVKFTSDTNDTVWEGRFTSGRKGRDEPQIVQIGSLKMNDELMRQLDSNDESLKVAFDGRVGVAKQNHVYDANDDLAKKIKNLEPVEEDPNKFALVIGIEDYSSIVNVKYASNSAHLFKEVLTNRLGVPKQQVRFLANDQATTYKIQSEMEQLIGSVNRFGEGAKIYFYYVGHGVPHQKELEAYILPSDLQANDVYKQDFLKIDNMLNKLTADTNAELIAFVDTCFSGRDDKKNYVYEGNIAPGLVRRKDYNVNSTKATIFKAGKADEFALGFEPKSHRLFSYFLLDGLIKQSQDNSFISAEKLHKHVYKHVRTQAKITSNADQTPLLEGNTNGIL